MGYISPVGSSEQSGYGYFVASQTISLPSAAIGDVVVVGAATEEVSGGASCTVSGVSGGGVTTWHKLVGLNAFPPGFAGADAEIWWGVRTSAGTQTVTVSYSPYWIGNAVAQQFTSSFAGTWTADSVTATQSVDSTGSSGETIPSMTPSNSQSLYLSMFGITNASVAHGPGGAYVDIATNTSRNLLVMYDVTATGVQGPTFTASGTTGAMWSMIAGALYIPGASTPVNPIVMMC